MRARGFVVLAVGGTLAACTPEYVKRDNSDVHFEIGAITTGTGNVLYSDVSKITNDDATVTVNIFPKNGNVATSGGALQHVYVDRYEVRFFRTDGRNVEGVDVPFRISGPAALRLHSSAQGSEVEGDITVTVVRQQAKLEPPLRNLRGTNPDTLGGSALVITTIAEITIYGRSLNGDAVKTVGRLQVTFADFID